MNITLSVDEKIVVTARRVARSLGKSLNQLVRDYLEQLTQPNDLDKDLKELQQLSRKSKGRSKGWRFNREDLHERP